MVTEKLNLVEKPKKFKKDRSLRSMLDTVLYCRIEWKNAYHAKIQGKKHFGSVSAYINQLISKDRGVSPGRGYWGTRPKPDSAEHAGQ